MIFFLGFSATKYEEGPLAPEIWDFWGVKQWYHTKSERDEREFSSTKFGGRYSLDRLSHQNFLRFINSSKYVGI